MDLVAEKAVSSRLSTLPIEEFVFSLHKDAFRDALVMHLLYGAPFTCSCGTKFSIEHSLSCPRGGFTIIRHNEIRDLTATILIEVCHNVNVEPTLQPITGEEFSGTPEIKNEGDWLDTTLNSF